jgi:hypothetical protein
VHATWTSLSYYLPWDVEMGEWLDTLDWDVRIGDAVAQGTEALHFDVKTSLRHYGPLSRSVAERLGGTSLDEALRVACVDQLGRDHMLLGEAISVALAPDARLGSLRFLIVGARWEDESPYTKDLMFRLLSSVVGRARQLGVRSLTLNIPALDGAKEGEHSIFDVALVRVLKENDQLKTAPPLERLVIVGGPDRAHRVEPLRAYLERNL